MNENLVRKLEPEDATYLADESRQHGTAQWIAFPRTEMDVAAALEFARKTQQPITVQGARTGITGGAVPNGGLILNMSRMNRILGLRYEPESDYFLLRVEPGILLCDLNETLQSLQFDSAEWDEESCKTLDLLRNSKPRFFPPDPTETSASVGGMVANNASGARSFAYGPTAQHVESLRALVLNGTLLELSRGQHKAQARTFHLEMDSGETFRGQLPSCDPPMVKCAAGYRTGADMDLVDLFTGMEGTLGVLTGIELRLAPAPSFIWGMTAFLPSEENALKFVRILRGERVAGFESHEPFLQPVAIEFFNQNVLTLLRRHKRENTAFTDIPEPPADARVAIYLEFHGDDEETVSAAVLHASNALVLLDGDEDATWLATEPRELARLAHFRHAAPEAVNLLIDERRKQYPDLTKLGTDMSVPDSCLGKIMSLYNNDLKASGLESVIFGHIGNNHLHVNILPRNPDEYAQGRALYLDWAREVVSMGGSVSAEHGIGKLKRAFLELMYGPEMIDEMRALKRVFDPQGLLNPGNLFEI
ncbi:MAG TPA: FAD-binding oxidoreductase [Candidatus Sumerlaeota bacterium]|nr:FAD-binding oxidoreductase [Candidatus Sumerlaeota bacterium]HPS00841.1 FAD-binding oxidoreductase [Candidatus Sumerlaeota bacterium]